MLIHMLYMLTSSYVISLNFCIKVTSAQLYDFKNNFSYLFRKTHFLFLFTDILDIYSSKLISW